MRALFFAALLLLAGCASTTSTHSAAPSAASVMVAPTSTHLTWNALDHMTWPQPQTTFHGYKAAVRHAAWASVYARGGTELYCRVHFTGLDAQAIATHGRPLSLEHAYPAIAAARHFGYADRDCRTEARNSANQRLCEAATGDLHNLWPAYRSLNSSHGDSPYGELPGESVPYREFTDYCPDYERGRVPGPDVVEPTEAARGDLARALLFMHYVYGLPLDGAISNPDLLLRWVNDDPPNAEEVRREERIETLEPNSWNPLLPRNIG